jgi:succinoglycan biosynthesis protein ExoM
MTTAFRVTVCACTYRRPAGLAALLRGLAAQRFLDLPSPRLDVIIADNEGSPEARSLCESSAAAWGLPVTYAHEPRRGISFARNACLDRLAPECDFFAMIDDDEVPEPDWLAGLLEMQQATGADVVKGPVLPVFAGAVAAWIVEGEFFGWPSRDYTGIKTRLSDGQPIRYADTNNVLVRTAIVRRLGLRFDPELALTGGESGVFFAALREVGAQMVFAAKAVTRETIPPERATLSYLCRIAFRIGNNRVKRVRLSATIRPGLKRIVRETARATGLPAMLSGTAHVLGALVPGRWSRVEVAVGALRWAYGLGRLASLLGVRYEHYRNAP